MNIRIAPVSSKKALERYFSSVRVKYYVRGVIKNELVYDIDHRLDALNEAKRLKIIKEFRICTVANVQKKGLTYTTYTAKRPWNEGK